MLLYRDVISKDEMFTDAFKIHEVDSMCLETIIVKLGEEVNIGANASAEEAQEEMEEGDIQVNNVVHSMRLTETQFDKKSYMTYIKGYMKQIKAHLEETNPARAEAFQAEAPAFVKKILANIKDYQFFVGESMNPEGCVALLNYREDGTTPYFTFFRDGLIEEKC